MNTPNEIYLIDTGSEITWCDVPDPSEYIEEEDVVKYVRSPARGENKMKDSTFRLVVIGLCVIGFGAFTAVSIWHIDGMYLTPSDMPEGYNLLCSDDGTKYTFTNRDGLRHPVTWDHRHKAISQAIFSSQHIELEYDDSKNYKWESCDTWSETEK